MLAHLRTGEYVMAPISGLLSYQLKDADHEPTSFDVPFTTSSGLLADIAAWVSTITPAIDLVMDGQILKIKLSLLIPLPTSGIKTSPATGAENERTGLFSMAASSTPNAYGLDFPSFSQLYFTGNQIDTSNANVSALITLLTTTSNSTRVTDRYGNNLVSVKNAVKTFRKHRRALRRA
jgi:hypothetical protein